MNETITYRVILDTPYEDPSVAIRKASCLEPMTDGRGFVVGQGRDFTIIGHALTCVVDVDMTKYQKCYNEIQEGTRFFVGDYPVVGSWQPSSAH